MRRLIISDLHFGSGDDLLAGADALERIEPELAWADELVVNGDLFELVFASVAQAVDAARPFLALADRHVQRVHYIPGNHDHHLVSLARDERRLGDALGAPWPAAPAGVAPATRVLRALCPTTAIVTAYPACELDGMLFTHGHYIDAHARSSDRWLMDSLAWQLTGAARPPRLTVEDYEALLAPLYEFMYEIANLPSGHRAQERFERWLHGAAAIAHAPQRLAALIHLPGHDGGERLLRAHDAPTVRVLEAMQAVCEDLALAPRTIVFGHTHVALDGLCTPDGRHRLFNSGAWVWDRGRARSNHGWPRRAGTVLRATGCELELRGLLDDCDERDLARMLDDIDRGKNLRCTDAHRRMDTFRWEAAACATAGGEGR